jgi:hypothetical protein
MEAVKSEYYKEQILSRFEQSIQLQERIKLNLKKVGIKL